MGTRCIVIGGFNTGKRCLEPLTDEAVTLFGANDGECLTFRSAMEARDNAVYALRDKVDDAYVITHSAGSMALEGIKARPRELVVVAGPEPRSIGSLVLRGTGKFVRAAGRMMSGPDRRGQARVVGSNAAEALVHTKANMRYLGEVSVNSVSDGLNVAAGHGGVNVLSVRMSEDEYFPLAMAADKLKLYPEVVLDGLHDDILVAPADLMRQIGAFRQWQTRAI